MMSSLCFASDQERLEHPVSPAYPAVAPPLEHNDRICSIFVWSIPIRQFEDILGAMRQPFPALKNLQLACNDNHTSPILTDSFLGGSAQSLEELSLYHIPFPGLPKLLVSATHLVNLTLHDIPHSGYISPEVMVTCLSALTRLEQFHIGFESPQSRPDRRRPPPRTRTLLPILDLLSFQGVSEYLEDLVARIDVPLLNDLGITFFHQLMFHTPQLNQLISRTPKFGAHDEAYVNFRDRSVSMELTPKFAGELELRLAILCRQSDWQLSSLAQACSSSFPQALIPVVERLHIYKETMSDFESENPEVLDWQDDIESGQWLELLHPFTAVKDLYIYRDFALHIAPALQELVEEGVTEISPALKTFFVHEAQLSGPAIKHFVAARQLASHPIAVSRWETL